MMSQQIVNCQIRQEAVCVTYMQMPHARGFRAKTAPEKRPLACACSADCPRTAFCRMVNPLTTRLPFDLNEAATATAS